MGIEKNIWKAIITAHLILALSIWMVTQIYCGKPASQRSAANEADAQRWVGTWVDGNVEFDIFKDPATHTYQLHNRTFNFTCDITFSGRHAHWHGPPGAWVMDADLSDDGKTVKAKGTDDQGSSVTKDFEFQRLPDKNP